MKNISWQRALIALLLMLNAIPFSYGPKFSPNIGILWAVAGWFILSWPILAESFCGPADGSRKFGLFDHIKVALSAVFLFFVVFFPVDDSLARVIFLLCCFAFFFFPAFPDRVLTKEQEAALYHLECVEDLGYRQDPAYKDLEMNIFRNGEQSQRPGE